MPSTTNKDLEEYPAMLRLSDLQEFLGISKITATKLVNQPGFPVVRVRKQFRIPRRALGAWLASEAGTQTQ